MKPSQSLLVLIGLIFSCRASSQRQCGLPPKNNLLYWSMPSDGSFPQRRVRKISKQNKQELISVTYSFPQPKGPW